MQLGGTVVVRGCSTRLFQKTNLFHFSTALHFALFQNHFRPLKLTFSFGLQSSFKTTFAQPFLPSTLLLFGTLPGCRALLATVPLSYDFSISHL
jgi:hypothetical protein